VFVVDALEAVPQQAGDQLHGPEHVARLLDGIIEWMDVNEYASVRMMTGAMSLNRCPAPHAYERANYMRVLQSWRAVNRP
jgi:dihydroorotate dehydrogenase (fumarate)